MEPFIRKSSLKTLVNQSKKGLNKRDCAFYIALYDAIKAKGPGASLDNIEVRSIYKAVEVDDTIKPIGSYLKCYTDLLEVEGYGYLADESSNRVIYTEKFPKRNAIKYFKWFIIPDNFDELLKVEYTYRYTDNNNFNEISFVTLEPMSNFIISPEQEREENIKDLVSSLKSIVSELKSNGVSINDIKSMVGE